jgi:hypothetical protein
LLDTALICQLIAHVKRIHKGNMICMILEAPLFPCRQS